MRKTISILIILSALLPVKAQNILNYEQMITLNKQEKILSFLADDKTQGRASGTKGKELAEQYIVKKFIEYGLKPYKGNYTQSFKYKDSIILRNVAGIIPASVACDEYIIISAHYDHIGKLNGTIYNGADDNASGVTAIINMAEMFSAMKKEGKGPGKNLIFVAFDGKELNMAGSEYFVQNLHIPKKKIVCNINIDMLGTDLVPVGKNREYLIILGKNSMKQQQSALIDYCNGKYRFMLDIDYTFYGSKDFTKIFYKLGDHYSFAKAGIPALFFTSAFHQHTYKPSDDTEIINFPLLRKRTLLIFNIVFRLCL